MVGISWSFPILAAGQARDTAEITAPNGFAANVVAHVFSNRISSVDDLLLLESGRVYVLDTARGRVVEFQDRALDGRADSQRTLPQVFNEPTAMTLHTGQLYVADKEAIWRVNAAGTKTKIANLSNAGAIGKIHLAPGDTADALIIGLTRDAAALLIDLEISTGHAQIRAQASGKLRAVKRLANGTLWTSVAQSEAASQFSFEMRETGPALKKIISDFTVTPKDGPWAGQLIAMMEGGEVIRLPMRFGRPVLPGTILMSSNRTRSRATSLVSRGALAADPRGIFVFDPNSKMLWVVKARQSPASISITLPTSPDDKTPDP